MNRIARNRPSRPSPRTDLGGSLEQYRNLNEAFDECVVYSLGGRGFFAEVSSVARAMIYALANKRQFLLDSERFAWRVEHGWADYFEPFCLTSANVDPSRIKERIVFGQRESFRKIMQFRPNSLRLGNVRLEGFYDILGFFMKMIFRPTAACQARIDATLSGLSLPDDLDVIHIRRGDKIGDEDVLFPVNDYLEVLEPIPDDRCLFVMTDDYTAVREVNEYLDQANRRVRVLTLCRPDQAGFDVGRLMRKQRFMNAETGSEAGGVRPEGEHDHLAYIRGPGDTPAGGDLGGAACKAFRIYQGNECSLGCLDAASES